MILAPESGLPRIAAITLPSWWKMGKSAGVPWAWEDLPVGAGTREGPVHSIGTPVVPGPVLRALT